MRLLFKGVVSFIGRVTLFVVNGFLWNLVMNEGLKIWAGLGGDHGGVGLSRWLDFSFRVPFCVFSMVKDCGTQFVDKVCRQFKACFGAGVTAHDQRRVIRV